MHKFAIPLKHNVIVVVKFLIIKESSWCETANTGSMIICGNYRTIHLGFDPLMNTLGNMSIIAAILVVVYKHLVT